jgi:hypothetical protein
VRPDEDRPLIRVIGAFPKSEKVADAINCNIQTSPTDPYDTSIAPSLVDVSLCESDQLAVAITADLSEIPECGRANAPR